jgi:tRNA pseudouridine32 synthase/23S rRNA pseudouridine746 synthase
MRNELIWAYCIPSSMTALSAPSDFISDDRAISNSFVTYWYQGHWPQSGELLRLPRIHLVECVARWLMQQLATDERFSSEGKMYGVLLVETATGEQRVLKAFSGLLNGSSAIAGWVPAIWG